MANKLQIKRGLVAGIPTGSAGEPLFTTDTNDFYIGTGSTNIKFQKYIASGATTQILLGDGSLYSFPLAISSPSNGQYLTFNGTSWVNTTLTGTGITTLNTLTATTQTFATGTSGTDFNISSATSTHTFNLPTASATNRGALSSTDWSTFNNKQSAITLTTTGSSGAATFVSNTLNIPNYTLSGLGGVPTTRTLTINGTAYDLSADRTWSVGTVTSVGMTVPTGFLVGGSSSFSFTTSGTFALTFASGYSLPTTSSQTNWDAAYNDKINSAAFSGTTTKTLTLTQQDGGTVTASFTDTGFANPMTLLGDTIYGGASGVATALAGNTTTTKQFLSQTGTGTVSAAPSWATITGSDITGAALTKTDDTNVTLTLGGTPATSLLRAASLTLGWTGQLAVGRGGSGASTLTGVLLGNGTSAFTAITGTASQYLRRNSGNTAYEFGAISGGDVTGAALTKTDDTNVTLTLGGTPATSLLRAASLTLGWSGQLSVARGGTGLSALGTANQLLRVNAGATALEYFTPSYLTAAITSLNGLTAATQTFAVGTSGTDFNISSATSTHTFNLPTASATNRGALSSADWTTFNNKQNALTNPVTGTGTTNYIPKWTSSSALGNSLLQEGTNAIGLSVTPSAWGTYKAIQVTNASLWGAVNNTYLGANYYYNGTNRIYISTGFASEYSQVGGVHSWSSSVSGTAGNIATLTDKMILDASGNLGLGVSPSSWDTVTPVFQAGRASFYGYGNEARLSANYYYQSGDKYIATDFATSYLQASGQHKWYTAPSGTAGNAITFTQAMTLDASGRLGVGTSSPDAKLRVAGTASSTQAIFGNVDGRGLEIKTSTLVGTSDAGSILNARGATEGTLIIQTEGTEVGRFTKTQNLLVGTTTDSGERLVVSGSALINGGLIKVGDSGSFTTLTNTRGIAFDDSASDYGIEFLAATSGNGYGHRIVSVDSGAGSGILKIQSRDNSTTWSETMSFRLGNVSIGTTSPTQELTVEGTDGSYLMTVQTSATNKPRFQVYIDDTNGVYLVSGYDTTAKPMRMTVGGSDRFMIKTTGQLQFNAYQSSSSFRGTAAGYLAFDSSGNIITTSGSGGSTTPAGSSGQVQFNSSGAFGADSNFNWDNTNKKLSIGTSTSGRKLTVYDTTIDNHILIAGTAPSVAMTDTITSATYQAKFGLATASNNFATGSVAGDFVISCQTGAIIWALNSVQKMQIKTTSQLQLHAYTSSSSFSGTAAGYLAFDSSGNVITVAVPSSGGITTLNTLTASTQTFAVGTSGSDFNISSATSTHTFNIPDASGSARGLVTTGTQTFAGIKTFSSKIVDTRIDPRSITTTSTATLTPDVSADDFFTVTAQAATITLANPTGTPVDGQKIIVRIKDNGTARTIQYGTQYRASSDLALPTTTTVNKTIYLGFMYNATDTKWDLLSLLNNI